MELACRRTMDEGFGNPPAASGAFNSKGELSKISGLLRMSNINLPYRQANGIAFTLKYKNNVR